MAKEPNQPNEKKRLPINLAESSKQLIGLFGGDKKHFEPIEDDDDDLVTPAQPATAEATGTESVPPSAEPLGSAISSAATNNDAGSSLSPSHPAAHQTAPVPSKEPARGRGTETPARANQGDSKKAAAKPIVEKTESAPAQPAKPAAKGIKSHWASLAAALGLRKKEVAEPAATPAEPAGKSTTKSTAKPIAADSHRASPPRVEPVEPDVLETEETAANSNAGADVWIPPATVTPQVSFDDLFANAPDLTESQVTPESFLGASSLDEVDVADPNVSAESEESDPDYVEFELAELDPVDRPHRIGRVAPPSAPPTTSKATVAGSADETGEAPATRRRRRRRRGKGDSPAAETTETTNAAATGERGNSSERSSTAEPAMQDPRGRTPRGGERGGAERGGGERGNAERANTERGNAERHTNESAERDRSEDNRRESSRGSGSRAASPAAEPKADRKSRGGERSSRSEETERPERASRGERGERGDRNRDRSAEKGGERSAERHDKRPADSRAPAAKTKREAEPIDNGGDDYIEYDGNPQGELTDDAKRITTWREAIDVIIDGNLSNRKRGGKSHSGGGHRPPRNHRR